MVKGTLVKEIIQRLFGEYSDKRLVVVSSHDEFLRREDVRMMLSYASVRVAEGDSLDLRLWWETVVKEQMQEDMTTRFVFLQRQTFRVSDDIALHAETTQFAAKHIFPRYRWRQIKDCSLGALQYLYDYPGRVSISELKTRDLLAEYERSYGGVSEKIETIIAEWGQLKVDFVRASEWMNRAADLMCRALEIGRFDELAPEIEKLNQRFQDYLKQSYVSIISSSVPPANRAPKNVCQVLPFIGKQPLDEKIALIVIDGMNFWQGHLLAESLRRNLDVEPRIDAIYSWLPSVTELSRQAIFRGSYPQTTYTQSTANESRMWEQYWRDKGMALGSQTLYEHGEHLAAGDSRRRVAWVMVGLDEKMHASDDFRYLNAATKLWVEEEELIGGISDLLRQGFKIYITTDHGNVETKPYRLLTQSEKAGAVYSKRHITLSPHADKALFEADHGSNVLQIDPTSRTYYPTGNHTFSNLQTNVTHGGTHLLEVLIPFITIATR